MNANQTVIQDFIDKHPFAAAQTLDNSDPKEVAVLLQGFPLEKKLKLLGLMTPKKAANCLALLPLPKVKELLQNGDSLFMASLLKLIDADLRSTFLSQISPNKAAAIERKLEHDPKSVGAFMERAVVTSKEMTVRDAITIIDRIDAQEEFYLHIIDVAGVFEGIIRCKDLLLADRDTKLETIINSEIPRFTAETPVEHVINDEAWDVFHYIPVVDKSGKLLGSLPYNFSLKMKIKSGGTMSNEIFKTGSALGELYRIGITGLINTPGK
jgi:magnesium transporter